MILVTGGLGFIGSHVAEALIARGEDVLVLDNWSQPERNRENEILLKRHPRVRIVQGDAGDFLTVRRLFENYQVSKVIHLAATPGVRFSLEHPVAVMENNVIGTTVLLDEMHRAGIKDFYFSSSSSVYGNAGDDTDHPISPYAASKKATELIAYTYAHLYGMKCYGFRFFTVYGERGRPDMAPYIFTKKILNGDPITMFGDGSTSRDYTYVGDIVDGIIASMQIYPDKVFQVFDLGNNSPIQLRDFIGELATVIGKKAKLEYAPKQPGDVENTCANITKAQAYFGYKPKVKLRDGLTKFVEWFKEHEL